MSGQDISGQRFGSLTAISRHSQSKNKTWKWLVRCDCGEENVAFITALKVSKRRCRKCQDALISGQKTKHGLRNTPEYRSWKSMKARCLNPKSPDYKDYGGRGITIDPRWINSFEEFLKDMGSRLEGYSLDRKDNNGNYCKDNCKWSTAKEQANNRRNNIKEL